MSVCVCRDIRRMPEWETLRPARELLCKRRMSGHAQTAEHCPALIENRLGRTGTDQLNPCQPVELAIHPGSVDAVKPALSSQTGYAGSPRRNQFGLPRGSRRWQDEVSVHDWRVTAAASSQKTKNPPFAAGSVSVPPERVELSLSD